MWRPCLSLCRSRPQIWFFSISVFFGDACSVFSFSPSWGTWGSLFCLLTSEPLTSVDADLLRLLLLFSFSRLLLGVLERLLLSLSSSLLRGNGFRSSWLLGLISTPFVFSSLGCRYGDTLGFSIGLSRPRALSSTTLSPFSSFSATRTLGDPLYLPLVGYLWEWKLPSQGCLLRVLGGTPNRKHYPRSW